MRTLALRGGWTVMEGLQLTLALENATDEDYRFTVPA
jgi:outer membrane receptor protein involved in Fe transport